MRLLRQSLLLARKDLRSELRSKETLNASLSFALVILLLFSFAFDPTSEQMHELAGGLLWIVFAYAGSLVINRSFARDLPNDCLDWLLAAPVSRAALLLGKAAANFVLLLILEVICLPIFGVFYNVPWTDQIGPLMMVLALTTWGFAVVGTIFSAMTVNLRLRELMLPMLMYPILIPCLLGAIQISTLLIVGKPFSGDMYLWLKVITGFDVIYTALALILVDVLLLS